MFIFPRALVTDSCIESVQRVGGRVPGLDYEGSCKIMQSFLAWAVYRLRAPGGGERAHVLSKIFT